MRLFVFTLLAFATVQAHAGHKELRAWLRRTSWCFVDRDFGRENGRLNFAADGTGLYDVTDAPGPGGIRFTWDTWEDYYDRYVIINYAGGFKPRRQKGDVVILDRNKIAITWVNAGKITNILNRCAPR